MIMEGYNKSLFNEGFMQFSHPGDVSSQWYFMRNIINTKYGANITNILIYNVII